MIRCEKGSQVITFYFYQTDQFVSQQKSFFHQSLVLNFKHLLNLIFKKYFTTFQVICYLLLNLKTLSPTVTE
jgi:hypothetical protein